MLPDHSQDYHIGWPRAFQTGVAILSACAFGALAYGYSGGPGDGRNTVPTPTATSEAFYEQVGPNYDAGWGMTKIFTLDPTQNDQSVINTFISQNRTTSWTTPGTSPDSGAFFNVMAGDTTTVAFRWPSGVGPGRIAGNEINVSATSTERYCETYVRLTFKASSWEYSDNTVKHFFFRDSANVGAQNSAPGVQTAGNEASSINTSPEFRGTTSTTDGVWYDDEYYYSTMGASASIKIWRDGVLEADTTGIGTGSQPWSRLWLGPYHGGSSGTKSTSDDQWIFSRIVIYAEECP